MARVEIERFTVFVVDAETQHRQVGQDDLPEQEWVFFVNGVQTVGRHHSGFELFSYCVRWQTVHVHLDVGPHLFIRQELAGNYLST